MSTGTASTTVSDSPSAGEQRDYAKLALYLGVGGLFIALIGLILGVATDHTRAVMSWLIGLSFWLSIAIGTLMLTMLFHVFKASWSVVFRRTMEHMLAAFPWLGLLFVPLLLIPLLVPEHAGVLWKWMQADYTMPGGFPVAEDALYLAKAIYLNYPFFLLRAVLYFGSFIALAHYLRKFSFAQDKDGDPAWTKRMLFLSAGGIFVAGMSLTFAAFDWFMSLEFHWFSTMYGVWFFAACMRVTIAVCIIMMILMSVYGPLKGLLNSLHYYLFGCMALAFTVFWAYISFAQYFLIYNANIPEETFWYNIRIYASEGGYNPWWYFAMALVFLYFLFPFLYLLWYRNKVNLTRIAFISIWIIGFHLIDLYFNIVPGKEAIPGVNDPLGYVVRQFGGLDLLWDAAALIGVGGICVWAFLTSLKKEEAIPIRDPRIQKSIDAHE